MDTLTRMRCFVQVVDQGGFSAAAREMGRSKALVSKYVGELEAELGARLLNRTTRQISTTETGRHFYEEAVGILQRVDELADTIQNAHAQARGLLRVSAPRSMGDGLFNQAVMEFLRREPDISIDLRLEDRFVDLVEEGFDVALRVSELPDSALIARKLTPFKTVVCATPALVAQYGRPEHPQSLAKLPCIVDTNYRFRSNWGFSVDGAKVSVPVKGRVLVNSAQAAREAVLCDLGFLRTPELFVHGDIAEGRLIKVLDEFHSSGQGVYVVYPHRDHLPGKVRVFVDFLVGWFAELRRKGEIC